MRLLNPITRARLNAERGATDPILIIAGIAITLILLVGGSFAISGFIGNAHDVNAKSDLDRIATAQNAYLAENDRYGGLSLGPDIGEQDRELADASVGFTPTDGNNVIVRTTDESWLAVTRSASGKVFMQSSADSGQTDVTSAVGTFTPWTELRRNLVTNPAQVSGGSMGTTTYPTLLLSSVATDGHPSILTATRATAAATMGLPAPAIKLVGDYESAVPNGAPVVGGQRYQFALDWRASANPGVVRLKYRFHNGTSWLSTVQTQAGVPTPNGSYTTQAVGGGIVAPAGATGVAIGIDYNRTGGMLANSWFEYTGLYFGPEAGAPYYFPVSSGTSTLRTRWLGTPNASTSVLESRSFLGGTNDWEASLPAGFTREDVSEMASQVAG